MILVFLLHSCQSGCCCELIRFLPNVQHSEHVIGDWFEWGNLTADSLQEKALGTKHNSAAGGSDDGTRLRWSGMDVFSVLMSRGYANTAARVETKSLYCLGLQG